MTDSSLVGNVLTYTGAPAGSERAKEKTQLIAIPATIGSLAVFTSSGWVALAPGTEGQSLKMVSGVPAWAS